MQRWPSRRPPKRSHSDPPWRQKASTASTAPTTSTTPSGADPTTTKPATTKPGQKKNNNSARLSFTPPRYRDAWASLLAIAIVLALLASFLYYLTLLWLPAALPDRIVYFAILGATVLAVLLFAVSFLGFVLPRAVGLRRAPKALSGKD